jgi:hypothetical protein
LGRSKVTGIKGLTSEIVSAYWIVDGIEGIRVWVEEEEEEIAMAVASLEAMRAARRSK